MRSLARLFFVAIKQRPRALEVTAEHRVRRRQLPVHIGIPRQEHSRAFTPSLARIREIIPACSSTSRVVAGCSVLY